MSADATKQVNWKLGVVLTLTVICLAWFLWGINLETVRVSIDGIHWGLLGLGVLGYLGTHVCRSFRLSALLEKDVPVFDLFAINCIGYLAINVVPLRLGEFVRPYLLLERHDVPFGMGMAALFLERLMDMLCLVGMLLMVTWLVDLPPGGIMVGTVDVVRTGQLAAGVVVGLGALGLSVVILGGAPLAALVTRFSVYIPIVGEKLPPFFRSFQEAPMVLVKRPARGVVVLVTSVLAWASTVGGVWCSLLAFDGLPHGWDAALTSWSITLSGLTVAPTPGFFGSFEAFCTAALMLWSVDLDVARTFAVVHHLSLFGFTVGIGLLFLIREGLSLRNVVKVSQEVATQ